MTPLQPRYRRILSIDATRGMAMAFVALAHFSWTIDDTQPLIADAMERIAMLATPTFLLLSGAMLGLLQLRKANALAQLASRLFHRGLFMLVVGHLGISAASAMSNDAPYWSVVIDRVYITDVVGICLMVLPRLAAGRDPRFLLTCGVGLYLGALAITLAWEPAAVAAIYFKQALFGTYGNANRDILEFASPLIPYMGVYLVGIAIGLRIDDLFSGAAGLKRIVGVAIAMVAIAAFVKLGWILGHKEAGLLPFKTWQSLTSPFQKLPPGPVYLMTFAGLGTLALASFTWFERHGMRALPVRVFAVLGQSSLFVFILQFYIYGPMSTRPDLFGGDTWWLVFPGTLALIWVLALAWRRLRGNRLFDITYRLAHRSRGGDLEPLGPRDPLRPGSLSDPKANF